MMDKLDSSLQGGEKKKKKFSFGTLKLHFFLEHAAHHTMSLFQMLIPIAEPVETLKKECANTFKVRPEDQEWWFKGKKLKNSDLLCHMTVRGEDKVTVREVPSHLILE